MELMILCLLSWLWTPGAAPPRGLDHAGDLQIETRVGDVRSLARSGPLVSAGDLKGNISQGASRKGSSLSAADDQPDWDFTLVLIAISLAALVLISYCCFHQKCRSWLLYCLHLTWQGWMDNRRCFPRISFINSLQHYGAFASRAPQSPAVESSRNMRLFSSTLHSEAFVHFRRASISKNGPASLSAAASRNRIDCGPTSEIILEMEDEL